jgi:hypothetical protein
MLFVVDYEKGRLNIVSDGDKREKESDKGVY